MEFISKGELMRSIVAGVTHEAFTHETEGTFDITVLRDMLKRKEPAGTKFLEVGLDHILPFVAQNRVVDPQRVMELPRESWQDDPGIVLVIKDGDGETEETAPTILMIDGHHRAVRRGIERLKTMRFAFVPIDKAPRPAPGTVSNTELGIDWGDPIVDGKIVRRG